MSEVWGWGCELKIKVIHANKLQADRQQVCKLHLIQDTRF